MTNFIMVDKLLPSGLEKPQGWGSARGLWVGHFIGSQGPNSLMGPTYGIFPRANCFLPPGGFFSSWQLAIKQLGGALLKGPSLLS